MILELFKKELLKAAALVLFRVERMERARQIQCEQLGLSGQISDKDLKDALKKHAEDCLAYKLDPSSTKKQLEQAIFKQRQDFQAKDLESELKNMETIFSLHKKVKSLKEQIKQFPLRSLQAQLDSLIKRYKEARGLYKQHDKPTQDELRGLFKIRFQEDDQMMQIIKGELGLPLDDDF